MFICLLLYSPIFSIITNIKLCRKKEGREEEKIRRRRVWAGKEEITVTNVNMCRSVVITQNGTGIGHVPGCTTNYKMNLMTSTNWTAGTLTTSKGGKILLVIGTVMVCGAVQGYDLEHIQTPTDMLSHTLISCLAHMLLCFIIRLS